MERRKNSGEYWNVRLTPSPTNPFPLAPGDLVASGKVTEREYRRQNARFGKFCDQKMEPELRTLPPGGIHVLGAGIARDLSWIKTAVRWLKFSVNILDFSEVAVHNAEFWIEFHSKKPGIGSNVKVTLTEIMSGWESGKITEEGVVAIYASQFIEHQDENLPKFLKHFAEFLRADPRRRIYLVLPRLEDNPPEQVRWNSAVLRKDHEWQEPLLKEFGERRLAIEVLGTHRYFHRTYTMFRIAGT